MENFRKKFRNHTIDEALEIITLTHDYSENRPILINVHGAGQDAGKSYFCKYAMNKLHSEFKHDVSVSKENPDSYVRDNYNTLEYLFFDVGTNKSTPDNIDILLWNRKINTFTKRNADLNIFLYNPSLHNPNLEIIEKYFDIIIENKDSTKKGLEPPEDM